MLFQRRYVLVGMFLAATIVAGCSGGSGPAPTLAPTPSASPGSSITTLNAIPGIAGTLSLPAIGGITPAFGIGAGAPSGLTLSTVESLTAPANAPVVLSKFRKAAAGTSITPFLYITATFSAAVPSGIVASELLTLPASLPVNADYYCELDDITTGGSAQGLIATFGPAVPSSATSSATVTFTDSTSPSLTAGHTYLFQYYEVAISPTPTPSPSPTPTASPSPTPSPTATASGATPTPSPSPSPSPTATASPTPTPVPTATPTPAGTPSAVPSFVFSGPSVTDPVVTPPTQPAPLVVPAPTAGGYGTYGVHVTISWGTSSGSSPFALSAALGSTANDITPAAQFPFYTGSAATPLFYLDLGTSASVSFAKTPAITVTASSFGSSNLCSLFIYGNTTGSSYQWIQVPGAQANVSGNTVNIPAVSPVGGQTITASPGQVSLAFVGC